MECTLCVIGDIDPALVRRPLPPHPSVLHAHAAAAAALEPTRTLVLCPPGAEADFQASHGVLSPRILPLEARTWDAVLATLKEQCPPGEVLVITFADGPFLNPVITRRLLDQHRRYQAHFTFADAYPQGLAPEILASDALEPLLALQARSRIPLDRHGLFELIKTDINSFDVETDIASDDVRMLRLQLYAHNTDGATLVAGLWPLVTDRALTISPEDFTAVVRANPDILRTVPSWFTVQITERCPHQCSYCPWGQRPGPRTEAHMPVERFTTLVAAFQAWNPQGILNLSLWGEPSLHPHILDLITYVLDHSTLGLYIETSGVGWPPRAFEALAAHRGKDRLTWILSLDARDDTTYRAMRGEGFIEAWACARELKALFGAQVYVQAVRNTLNEDSIQRFWKESKAEGFQVIVQKYNHFSHRLPDRRVADIAPYHRFPCWHVKRDFTILLDGRVVPCRDDWEGRMAWGNVFEEDLRDIWARGQALHRDHARGVHPGLCEFCDEYYSFNA